MDSCNELKISVALILRSCELDKGSKPPWSEQKRLGSLLTENIYIHREIMHSCNFIGLHMQGC